MSMHKTFYSRIEAIAEEDFEREQELGASCPSKLDLVLKGGHVLSGCWLQDSLNSLDDESIDVCTPDTQADEERGMIWVVPIAAIVALKQTYPREAERAAASAKAAS
jgi:hypothetical protein